MNLTIGEIIGKKIDTFLAVDSRMAGGERGKLVRVQVELPLDKPIKRGGHVTLGSGTKHWVDYKYERLNKFCYYCGSLLHEQVDCASRQADEEAGSIKDGRFRPWLKAGGGGVGGGG